MILLSFFPDSAEVAAVAAELISGADALHLGEFHLLLPVRFSANGRELFTGASDGADGWPRITTRYPVLDLAARGLSAVRTARRRGRAEYAIFDPPRRLVLSVTGDVARVDVAPRGTSGPVACGELMHVWEQFAWDVRLYLAAELPQLLDTPFWGAWLRGAEYEEIPPSAWHLAAI